ncbi:hypothetical protein [Actinacidiphila acididurans]|uniref:Uncharacterized protein n=1 Tax=Actinacidiphila acididurans TaxID=2784346 RepID=A0ABS2TLU8_9ACTN|nr:hypothetical protein [Actinacidiphila acididurans]MBM9504314.1 hypothetical protein [Actinacidiphila acididurans]
MGFSGDVVFGRSERPLTQAPFFARVGEAELKLEEWWPRPGGWQTVSFDYGLWEPADLDDLVAWTGAPACFASVHDSDVAWVTGLGTDGRRWEVCLHLDVGSGMWAEEPDDLEDMSEWVTTPENAEATRRKRAELDALVPGAAREALHWAERAGVPSGATAVAIETLMRSQEVFVEDLFASLLDHLGFPAAVES